ncbi:hypothetical protein CK203_012676 [Vitis vinifera]|uniref:Uncharacterized protein n=1 Tax=Vitis vinifera TaxID=29760 RepID=A0A438KMG6_VITVI|nr:hypothetical protein CK203_012676 [Vitis vinifera]
MDFQCLNRSVWKEALSSYSARIVSLNKPQLVSLDDFYCNQLPALIRQRNPNPYITTSELSKLMQWKLTRGKWRPRLLDFVSSLDEALVKSASQKAFQSLPDISKAISELTVLKGVGPATASALLAAYAPDVAPFMSDEAMVAALGNSKDYTLKQYLVFADKLQNKARSKTCAWVLTSVDYDSLLSFFVFSMSLVGNHFQELSVEGDSYTPSDVERALWSSAVGTKLLDSLPNSEPKVNTKRKRKQ